jgi:beta-phosphoglucomutase-like phosphatase (HAD superfamily)
MIKLIIFDLDGVLVSTKDLHYEALNSALEAVGSKYVLVDNDHLKHYDGLNIK